MKARFVTKLTIDGEEYVKFSEYQELFEDYKHVKEAIRPFVEYGNLPGIKMIPPDFQITQGSKFAARQIFAKDFQDLAKLFPIVAHY